MIIPPTPATINLAVPAATRLERTAPSVRVDALWSTLRRRTTRGECRYEEVRACGRARRARRRCRARLGLVARRPRRRLRPERRCVRPVDAPAADSGDVGRDRRRSRCRTSSAPSATPCSSSRAPMARRVRWSSSSATTRRSPVSAQRRATSSSTAPSTCSTSATAGRVRRAQQLLALAVERDPERPCRARLRRTRRRPARNPAATTRTTCSPSRRRRRCAA